MKKQYTNYLKDLKARADKAYEMGSPIMEDSQYDAIFGESSTVGAEVGDIPHMFPMYSLQKHYSDKGAPPLDPSEGLVETPKLDGSAVSLLYYNGILIRALTRGNGRLGRCVLRKVEHLVPNSLDINSLMQITGEVVAHKSVENSRNAAAGALNLKSEEEFKDRIKSLSLKFVVYGVQSAEDSQGLEGATYTEDLALLGALGFSTVKDSGLDNYPQDGKVYRVNSNKRFNELGFTSKHPKGAYAYKERAKPKVTKLLDVVWQTGKSGKVTPVGILEPVNIDGARVSRATLNNMSFIDSLGLEIGCFVEVVRSGEIIPCIVGKADENSFDNS